MRDRSGGSAGVPQAARRGVVRGALGGLGALMAGPALLPLAAAPARAAPADPGAGRAVTPDPIPGTIERSGLAVELVDFSRPPRTSPRPSYTQLNFLYHAGDGTGFLYAADGRGKIWRINRRTGAARPFLDLLAAWAGALVFRGQSRSTTGLRSFAFHPDYARRGAPGHRKLYTASTETAASHTGAAPLFAGPYRVDHHDVIAEWTVGAASPPRVDPNSRRELLRIAQYKDDHNADQLMFDPNARPGAPGYGRMFVGVGDGGNVPARPDPFNQAQDLRRALGKILCIDPLRQTDGRPYGVPADNPFVGMPDRLPEIWAYGLRHPLNLSFDTGGTGAMIITDIGQEHVEEVNLGARGANYGWPLREGTFVTDRANGSILYAPPPDDASRGFAAPVAQYDHTENGVTALNVAIVGGYVYRGAAIPSLVGHYLFGDIVSGRVFHVPVDQFRQGSQATVKELTLLRGGQPTTLLALVASPNNRVDLRFGQDEAGEVYVMTKQDGIIRRMLPAA